MAELSFRIDELMQEKSQSEGRAVTFYAIAKETGLSHQRIKAYADNSLVFGGCRLNPDLGKRHRSQR